MPGAQLLLGSLNRAYSSRAARAQPEQQQQHQHCHQQRRTSRSVHRGWPVVPAVVSIGKACRAQRQRQTPSSNASQTGRQAAGRQPPPVTGPRLGAAGTHRRCSHGSRPPFSAILLPQTALWRSTGAEPNKCVRLAGSPALDRTTKDDGGGRMVITIRKRDCSRGFMDEPAQPAQRHLDDLKGRACLPVRDPNLTFMMLLSFLQWGGVSFCSLGGLLALVGVAKGRQARELSTATQVENLAGAGWLSEGAGTCSLAVRPPPLPPAPWPPAAQPAAPSLPLLQS